MNWSPEGSGEIPLQNFSLVSVTWYFAHLPLVVHIAGTLGTWKSDDVMWHC
jgi:hypothetical protein